MGAAIAGVVTKGGNTAQVLSTNPEKASAAIPAATHGAVGEPITGDIVILALPYGAVDDVLSRYAGRLDGRLSSTSPTPSTSPRSTPLSCLPAAPPLR